MRGGKGLCFLFFFCFAFFFPARGNEWSLLQENLYPWKGLSLLDRTDSARNEALALWGEATRFVWEWDDTEKGPDKDALFTLFSTTALCDIDVFYGREGFPEGRRLPLYKGNNHNLTLNGTPLYSDDYLYRAGSVKSALDLFINKETEHFHVEGELSLESGENFQGEDTRLSFDHLSLIYRKGTRLRVGKIRPFFGPFLLDKRDHGIAGFEVETELAGTRIHFVAARPDIPLDFTGSQPGQVFLDKSSWTSGDVIYHFPEPFHYFEVEELPVRVFEIRSEGGEVFTRDITALCTTTHSDVIIPEAVLLPETIQVEIRFNTPRNGARQQMYINAFQIEKSIIPELALTLSYVDLHNDTHSVENTQGLQGPLDSNIWSLKAFFEKDIFEVSWQYALSKIVPDDNLFDDREIDFIHRITAKAELPSFAIHGEYGRMGADYLPHVLSLRDKWKLFTDRDADFRWNYEDEAALGQEGGRVSLSIEGFISQQVAFSAFKKLPSPYMQKETYAQYDRFYLPYYSSVGNDFRLYGPGIDDGEKVSSLSWTGRWRQFKAGFMYETRRDEDLVISPLEKEIKTLRFSGEWDGNGLFFSAVYSSTRDKIYYSPHEGGFIFQGDDKTLHLSGEACYKAELPYGFALKVIGEGEYIDDADSFYEKWESQTFREMIFPADRVDENVFRFRSGLQLFYTFKNKGYVKLYYQREDYAGGNSLGGLPLDYLSYERGIKFFSDFGEENFRFAAFYDEYELRFDHWASYDYSFKRIGALLEMKF